MASEFGIDVSSLQKFARRMAEAVPKVQPESDVALLRSAVMGVIPKAKANASWSKRIPGSIRVIGGAKRVIIRAGGARAPHAKPYEGGGTGGSFRHPLFGDREHWYDQKTRPFVGPAVLSEIPEIRKAQEEGVLIVARGAGYL